MAATQFTSCLKLLLLKAICLSGDLYQVWIDELLAIRTANLARISSIICREVRARDERFVIFTLSSVRSSVHSNTRNRLFNA
jgi:hypothetical protein